MAFNAYCGKNYTCIFMRILQFYTPCLDSQFLKL